VTPRNSAPLTASQHLEQLHRRGFADDVSELGLNLALATGLVLRRRMKLLKNSIRLIDQVPRDTEEFMYLDHDPIRVEGVVQLQGSVERVGSRGFRDAGWHWKTAVSRHSAACAEMRRSPSLRQRGVEPPIADEAIGRWHARLDGRA
jgi:hypothetical protein